MIEELKKLEDLGYYPVTKDNPLFIKLEPLEKRNVYHYTTKNSAKSILHNNCLWVTRSDYLDDKLEIKYISKVLEGVIMYLKTYKTEYDVGVDGQYSILESIIKTLEALREMYKITTPILDAHTYLLSLTESKNNKFLLKNYAGKHGVVLAFVNNTNKKYIDGSNTMFKDDKFNKYKIPIFYGKVVYDIGKQITIILEDINEFYSELITNLLASKGRIVLESEVVKTIKTVMYSKIIHYALFFKHEKFFKEEECRIAFIVGDDSDEIIKYRKRGNEMIPYIEVKFDKESLSKVSYR